MISNCLFSAIIYKLKDRKNTDIIIFPRKFNKGHFHVFWTDKKNNKVLDFISDDKDNKHLFKKGHIRKVSSEAFEQMMLANCCNQCRLNIDIYNMAKKLNLSCTKERYFYDWQWYSKTLTEDDLLFNGTDILPSIEQGRFFTKKIPYIEVKFKEDKIPVIKVINITEKNWSDNLPDHFFWRYITPFTDIYKDFN